MKIIVYQYTEPPLVLEDVTEFVAVPDRDEAVVVSPEGRLTMDLADIMKIELEP